MVQRGIDRLLESPIARTVVIVAHRLSTIKDADVIAVLDNGSIVEKGTHDDLLGQGGLYSKLVKHQLN